MNFRYKLDANWYKGSLHLHSNRSDGHLSLTELAAMYADRGYDFLAITDHWQLMDGSKAPLPSDLTLLDGVELDGHDTDGTYHHVVVVGKTGKLPVGDGDFLHTLHQARENGSLLVWAHPHWTGNRFDEKLGELCHGLEIYNHVSHCENGSGYALAYWDHRLKEQPDYLGFATDDTHFMPGEPFWNGGWIMVNAPSPAPDDLLEAIKRGNFYSSQNPLIYNLQFRAGTVTASTSPCLYARLIGPRREGYSINGLRSGPFTRASFAIPPDWKTARLEVEDANGKIAWTNPLFLE
jgi:hypothetical protein